MKKLIYISLIFVISNAFAQPAATVLFAKQKVISLREGKEYSLSRALNWSQETLLLRGQAP